MAEGSSGLITRTPLIDECYYYKPVYPAEVIKRVELEGSAAGPAAPGRHVAGSASALNRDDDTLVGSPTVPEPSLVAVIAASGKVWDLFVIVTLTDSWLTRSPSPSSGRFPCLRGLCCHLFGIPIAPTHDHLSQVT